MAQRNQDIKARLLTTFRVEAEEHVQAITANLLALERELPPEQALELLEVTFREVHTLKGAARSVSLRDTEALCQALEAVLGKITRSGLGLTRPVLDLLHEGVRALARLLVEDAASVNVRDLVGRLEQAANEAGGGRREAGVGDQKPTLEAPPPGPQPLAPAVPTDSIRVATARLDALLLQAEDLLAPMLAAGERVRESRGLVEAIEAGVGGQGLDAGERGAPRIRRTLSPALLAQARELLGQLVRDERTMAGTVGGLLEELRRLRMTPASTILDLFPGMVRDLARGHGKEVEWTVQGVDLEMDRKILETMKDPLIHLIRNAIDHGIELPEARAQGGKPRRGRVAVTIAPLEGNRIEIRVEDDGRGIDLAGLKAAAIRTHLLTIEEAETLTDDAALDLIYRSGLSTSRIITDLSGHGLGLAIVRERVERLGGRIRVATGTGAGTTVRMLLPASIASFRGLLVHAGGQPFLLPLEAVERAIRVTAQTIESVEGRNAIRWNGQVLPIARLSDILGLAQEQGLGEDVKRTSEGGAQKAHQPPTPNPQSPVPCVIVKSGEERVAFLVEEILGDREVLVKELRPPLIRIRNVAAAGLLGTGQVVLILRPTDLFKALREAPRPSSTPVAVKEDERPGAVLVVDDSITTRVMEKNLLEAAGYQVRAAADGIEAWTLLKSEAFDLVVSDIDMPRMDGFDLTARIRADRKLADLPVVLVTALESREDKERGIEVGANAYVVKSSFDQSNLLEIIRRLT